MRILVTGTTGYIGGRLVTRLLGAGSASFEMLRYLSERLPVMVTPQWVGTQVHWWSVAPFHGIVFGGMTRNIVGAAEGRVARR